MDSVYLVNLYLAEKQQKECTFRLLFDHEKESRAYLRFSSKIQTVVKDDLTRFESFITIDTGSKEKKMKLWADELGYEINHSAPYNEHHFRAWRFIRVASNPDKS